jgi:hypothetical protein
MKKAVFLDMAPCRLTDVSEERIASIFFLFSSTLKMEALRSSETSANTISTRRHFPEDRFLLKYQDLLNAIHLFSGCCMRTYMAS